MSKFNTKAPTIEQSLRNRGDATTNHEGGLSFKMSPETALVTTVLGTFLENRQYESGHATMKRIEYLVAKVVETNPEFPWQLAAVARQKWNLRSVAVFLAVLASEHFECRQFTRKWFTSVIFRADEPNEFLALWTARNGHVGNMGSGKPFPNSLKKAFADFYNFKLTEYNVDKYFKNDMAVKFRDLIKICHMKGKDAKQQALFEYLYTNGVKLDKEALPLLAGIYEFKALNKFDARAVELINQHSITWEVALTKFGNKPEVWNALNLPIMAALRNLRNMLQCGADVSRIVQDLQNPHLVAKSRQLPFRFYSAYRAIEKITGTDAQQVRDALTIAIELSVQNIPMFTGTTVGISDVSGSMTQAVSKYSDISCLDVACMFGGMTNFLSESGRTIAFATNMKEMALSKRDTIMTNMEKMKREKNSLGGGTVAVKTIQYMAQNKIFADRIFLFSDLQCYNERRSWNNDDSFAGWLAKYRYQVNPKAKLYSVNLAGLETALTPEDDPNTILLSGFSDRVFEFVTLFEQDHVSLVDYVRNITPAIL